MKLLLTFMLFFIISGCSNKYLDVESINKTMIQKEVGQIEIDVHTNIKDVIITSIENNEKFEYEVIETTNGYKYLITLYNPKSFNNINFRYKNQDKMVNVGEIEIVEKELNNPGDLINLVVTHYDDEKKVFIYNKTLKTIRIKEISVFGGSYLQNVDYNEFIVCDKLTYIGNIYTDGNQDGLVIYVKYNYLGKNYEQIKYLK